MATNRYRVIFTERAWSDLEDIVGYWADRSEPERGEQYAHDLPAAAIQTLSDPVQATAGRLCVDPRIPKCRNLRCSNVPIAFSIGS